MDKDLRRAFILGLLVLLGGGWAVAAALIWVIYQAAH